MTQLTRDSSASTPRSTQPFLERVRIKNYKSIARCDVKLGPLTILVGRNGAGKSNFLEALRFVTESLETSLDHAIKARGGVRAVRRHSTGHPHNFAIRLDMHLSEERFASYAFEVRAEKREGFSVKREKLDIVHAGTGERRAHYHIENGHTLSASPQGPEPVSDRLYLVAASSLKAFRPAYDALRTMGFYNLNPQQMKELQSPDAGELLRRDGSNIASVIARLEHDSPELMARVRSYLEKIAPGVAAVSRRALGPKETLEFRQDVKGAARPWTFHAVSMSDGTLRALGALVAVTQLADRASPVRLVGIEEPEAALHPFAAGALVDALREVCSHTQVLVTTHSADLLDAVDPSSDRLLVVVMDEGRTSIGPLDETSRSVVKEHLYSGGELQRMDQLAPDPSDLARQEHQLDLFGDWGRGIVPENVGSKTVSAGTARPWASRV